MPKKKKINKPVKDLKDFDDPNSQINKNRYKLDQIGKKKRRKYVQNNRQSLQIAGVERVTEKGYFVDEKGDAYINTPNGLLNDGEYDPAIHGLYVPLAERQKRQRAKLKIGTA
tara:strand:- start:248 stop:586 length:339 start_codon:yes stop_codon:yes gene_type:complete